MRDRGMLSRTRMASQRVDEVQNFESGRLPQSPTGFFLQNWPSIANEFHRGIGIFWIAIASRYAAVAPHSDFMCSRVLAGANLMDIFDGR